MEKVRYMTKVIQVVDGRNGTPTPSALSYSMLLVSYISHKLLLVIGLLNTYFILMKKIRSG